MTETLHIENTTTSVKERLMFGHNLDWWNQAMLVSLGVAAICALAVAFTTTVVVKMQKQEAISAQQEIAQANKNAAQAKEHTAVLEKQTAELEQEASNARLETENLKERLAWRFLPEDVSNKLVSLLSARAGQINIQYVAGDSEAIYFAIQLQRIFEKAHWHVGMTSVTLGGTVIFGLWVPDTPSPLTQTIRAAFGNTGIGFSSQPLPAIDAIIYSGNMLQGAAFLFVGSKPMPQ